MPYSASEVKSAVKKTTGMRGGAKSGKNSYGMSAKRIYRPKAKKSGGRARGRR